MKVKINAIKTLDNCNTEHWNGAKNRFRVF